MPLTGDAVGVLGPSLCVVGAVRVVALTCVCVCVLF